MKAYRCMATMIGSLPLTDADQAVELVFEYLDEAPLWPELPQKSYREDMVVSHTENLPGLVVDERERRCFVDTSRDCTAELAGFYEKALAAEQQDRLDDFGVSGRYASALAVTEEQLRDSGRVYPVFKVQSIGPVSFQLQLADESGKPLYYNETFQDVLARQITLQSRWMVRKFRPYGDTIMAFLDEPSLSAFGSSAQLGVLREDVIARLGAAVRAVKAEGAVVGAHICGNTDWPMIMEAGVDILAFDAYAYGESILMYARELQAHLERGGTIAWGIVPTSEHVRKESAHKLYERFFELIDTLSGRGIDRQQLLAQSLLTPSCGMGSKSIEDALLVMRLLGDLSRLVQEKVR